MKKNSVYFSLQIGFTLIELLIVIAILAILAVVLVNILDPLERIASAHDAGRISAIVQLGKAIESYNFTHTAYPDEASWGDQLVLVGFPNTFPSGIKYSPSTGVTPCITNTLPSVQNPSYCYDLDEGGLNGVILFSKLESVQKRDRCAPDLPYFVYSSADARNGTICSSDDPTVWASGTVTYFN